MRQTLDELHGMVAERDRDALVALLRRLIPDYTPDGDALK